MKLSLPGTWIFLTLWTLGIPALLKAEASAVMPCDTLEIEFTGGNVQPGDTICVDMILRGFTDVNSLQFSLNWDPSIIEYVGVQDVNPGDSIYQLTPLSFGATQAPDGSLRFVWFDNEVDGESVVGPYVVAKLCFVAVGLPGEKTSLTISDIPLRIEAEDPDGNKFCIPVIENPICITLPSDLRADLSSCSTQGSSGSITVKAWGDNFPFDVDIPSLGIAGDQIPRSGDCLVYDMLSPGSYTVIVRDASGNDTTMTIQVINAPPIQIDTVDLREPRCATDANGRIQIDVVGGVPDYVITWSPVSASGQTTLRRLPRGVYSVQVKDSMGCIATDTFDFNKTVLSIDSIRVVPATCTGRDNGLLEVVASGGTPFGGGLYDFFWSMNPAANNRGTSSTNDRLSGSGFVIVEDASGCRDTLNFDIPSEFNLEVDIEIDSVLCHGDSTGQVRITALTSDSIISPYFFIISELGGGPVTGGAVLVNQYNHDSIWAGQFTISLRDGAFCTLDDTFTIEQPNPLDIIIVDADTSAGCDPGFDAFIEVNGFEGAGGPFTFDWSHDNSTTPRVDSLLPGNYTVTVRDKNFCEANRTFEITGATGPTITGFDIKGIGCPTDTSGTIRVFYQIGDTTIRSIDWSNGASGEFITSLGTGQYIVTITDENGCTATDTAVIDIPTNGLQITSFIVDTPSCNGLYDGFLQINVAGGVGPYSFLWSNNSRDSILTNINAGRYIVSIRDQSNCPPVIDTFDIPEPPSIDIALLQTDQVSCNNDTTCDGRAIASASGGPDPSAGYIFTWESGEVGFGAPDTASALCRGDQLLIVSNGDCADTLDITIEAPPAIELDIPNTSIIRPRCSGDMDGSISVSITGGTGVKTVTWDRGGFMGNNLNNVGAGTYAFLVEDANNCFYRDSVEVKDPDPFDARILDGATTDITCPGGNDGRITIVWTGGNPGPATYDWSPVNLTDSVGTDLPAGDYSIVVTDSRGCTDTVDRTIVEPAPILADFPASDSVDCFGDQMPVTVIAANGGNGPDFTYSINNGSRRPLGDEVGLFAGSYLIRVFDQRGCSTDTTIEISQPADFMVDLGPGPIELELGDSLTICYQTNLTGRIVDSIVWTGPGTPEDSTLRCYQIKPVQNSIYSIQIFDEKGCEANDQIEVLVLNQGKVFVPNAFMPDGNANPVLTVFTGKGVQEVLSMEIYDRWGELVYRGQNLQTGEGWNGRWQNSGDFVMNDVYVYVVEVLYKDNTTEIRRGDVTLIR